MRRDQIDRWIIEHPLSTVQIDCVRTLMLKVIDGKCRMRPNEKHILTLLYDAVMAQPNTPEDLILDPLIAASRLKEDDVLRQQIYEHRVLAESRISRPTMKGFKAWLRERGMFKSQ